MNYKTFLKTFQIQVNALSHEKGLALAIFISKELFPDYQKFSERHKWGDPDLLLEAIKVCEESKTRIIDNNRIDPLVASLVKVIPDTENFGDHDASYALNASASVESSLLYVLDKSPKHLFEIGILYTETIYFRLQDMNVLEKETEDHPLMQAARHKLLVLSNLRQ